MWDYIPFWCKKHFPRSKSIHLNRFLRFTQNCKSCWILTGGLFVVLGNLLGKVRPNWFVGIRTPWTLSSKLAWDRTHRAGGWVFVLLGVLTMATAVLHAGWALRVLGVAGVASLLGLVVYSYVLWRRDPEKTPPAGTQPAP